MPDIRILYSTFPSKKEAEVAAAVLLDQNLIACANIFGEVRSLYRWEGQVQNEAEVVMIAKTTSEKLERAIEVLVKTHSYDCPCVTSWPVTGGSEEYLKWVRGEVG
jgi:periplasmic divalent cation tolerance protein